MNELKKIPTKRSDSGKETIHSSTAKGNYAQVNGLRMYYEVQGKGEPLVLLHGGLGGIYEIQGLVDALAEHRQVIAAELQGHARTADIDRPLDYRLMGDDIAALIQSLGLPRVDLMGYSVGAGTALRVAIQHPELVRKLIVVSAPFKRTGWHPEVLAGMAQLNAAAAEMMKPSPIYQEYQHVAPRPQDFPRLVSKVGDLLRQEYDWTDEVHSLRAPALLVFGDADSIPPSVAAEFFALLGGGQKDAGVFETEMPRSRLAILPATSHYRITASTLLPQIVNDFLDMPMPEGS